MLKGPDYCLVLSFMEFKERKRLSLRQSLFYSNLPPAIKESQVDFKGKGAKRGQRTVPHVAV